MCSCRPIRSDPAEQERPQRFIDHVVSSSQELPGSSLVVVNARYSNLIPAGTVTVVEVPSLRSNAIGHLIEHYARCSGLHITAEQVADQEALAYAAGRYARPTTCARRSSFSTRRRARWRARGAVSESRPRYCTIFDVRSPENWIASSTPERQVMMRSSPPAPMCVWQRDTRALLGPLRAPQRFVPGRLQPPLSSSRSVLAPYEPLRRRTRRACGCG